MKLHITKICPSCSARTQVEVVAEDLMKRNLGMSVQEAFPYLSKEEREILISGFCYECQEEIFKDDLTN